MGTKLKKKIKVKKAVKKKKFRLAVGLKASLCKLLEKASKLAKGQNELYDGKNYCLWGQAALMVGVSPKKLKGLTEFGDLGYENDDSTEQEDKAMDCWGAAQWDSGQTRTAVRVACKATKGLTVGGFIASLKKLKYLKA